MPESTATNSHGFDKDTGKLFPTQLNIQAASAKRGFT